MNDSTGNELTQRIDGFCRHFHRRVAEVRKAWNGRDVNAEIACAFRESLAFTSLAPSDIKHSERKYLLLPAMQLISDMGARHFLFDTIYDLHWWGRTDDRSGCSGLGSVAENCRLIERAINFVFSKWDIRTVFDTSCGDFVWMPPILEKHPEVEYTGNDIVGSLIRKHTAEHAGRQHWHFLQSDAVTAGIPGSFDLVICRHTLQHLHPRDGIRLLQHCQASGSRLLLVSTWPILSGRNFRLTQSFADVSSNVCHFYDLESEPYNMPPPVCYFNDVGGVGRVGLGLWRMQES